MKKKAVRHARHNRGSSPRKEGYYIILAKSWMFLVLFALMLGVGAIVGSKLSVQLNSPQVAGWTTTR